MLPYVLLICGAAFLSAILQVHRRFAAPAAAPILLNLCHIAVLVIGGRMLGLRFLEGDRLIEQQATLANWLGGFVLVAGVLQVIVLLPSLRATGFRFEWVKSFWTPAVKKMLRLSIPVAIGAGVLQLSVLIDKSLSYFLSAGMDAAGEAITHFTLFGWSIRYPMEVGAIVRLSWAQLLYQFPLGVFAIAIATAIFPHLSTEALDVNRETFRGVLRHGIEVTLLEGFAASVGLMIVAYPAVVVLFQHGQVTEHDARLVARSLIFYSAAIWAFSLQQVLNRAYYALHDTKTPLVMSIVTLGVNLLVEIPLLWTPLAEAGMAAGTAVSFSIQAMVMLIMIDRRVGGIGLGSIFRIGGKMALAAGAMALACQGVRMLPFYPQGEGKIIAGMQLITLMTTGAVVYLGACGGMGIRVMDYLRLRR